MQLLYCLSLHAERNDKLLRVHSYYLLPENLAHQMPSNRNKDTINNMSLNAIIINTASDVCRRNCSTNPERQTCRTGSGESIAF